MTLVISPSHCELRVVVFLGPVMCHGKCWPQAPASVDLCLSSSANYLSSSNFSYFMSKMMIMIFLFHRTVVTMKRDNTDEVLRVAHSQSRIVHGRFPKLLLMSLLLIKGSKLWIEFSSTSLWLCKDNCYQGKTNLKWPHLKQENISLEIVGTKVWMRLIQKTKIKKRKEIELWKWLLHLKKIKWNYVLLFLRKNGLYYFW